MLSILIQLNPGYLLGIMEKDPLVSHRRGMAEEVSRFRSPRRRASPQEGGGGRGRLRLCGCNSPRIGRRLGCPVFQLEALLFLLQTG